MPAIKPFLACAMLAAALGGCAVGPDYHQHPPKVPDAYGEAKPDAANPAPADPEVLKQWWTVFNDPILNGLIERALHNNRDLKVALSRVREARAEREVVEWGLLPELDASAGYNRSYGSKNVVIPLGALAGNSGSGASAAPASASTQSATSAAAARSPRFATTSGSGASTGTGASSGGSASSAPPGGPTSPFGEGGLPGVTTNLFQAGFDAVWEVDVFGGTRRAIEAASAQTAALQESARGIRVSLLAEVAVNYLQLRADQAREAVAVRNVEAQRLTWKIAEDKFRNGLGDELAVDQQAAQLRQTEASLPPLRAAEHLVAHTLAFLVGADPTDLLAELLPPQGLPVMPAQLPALVPSDLLRRRPDIRQAERQLAAATAQVGVATAQLFPEFSVTGSFGWDSSVLKNLPDWGSHYYSIAPGIRWPILDWSRLRAAIHAQNEEQVQAGLAYQTAVAQALKDVEDALVQYESEQTHHVALLQALTEARRARRVAGQVYLQGLSDQLATLEAERASLQAEDLVAQSDASLRVDLVTLYKALGGGWDVAAH